MAEGLFISVGLSIEGLSRQIKLKEGTISIFAILVEEVGL